MIENIYLLIKPERNKLKIFIDASNDKSTNVCHFNIINQEDKIYRMHNLK